MKIHRNSENAGDDNYHWFAWEKYGLQSTDIRALAFFYREPTQDNLPYWQTLEPSFQAKATQQQVRIRIATSLCLLNLGFLKEAGEPLNSCYQSAARAGDRLTAAMLAGLLGDRFLLQGEPEKAHSWLQKAMYRAKRQDNQHRSHIEQIRSKWAKFGNYYAYVDEWDKAKNAFNQMMKSHKRILKIEPKLPKYPLTRSGYYYCDYLLTIATLAIDGVSLAALGYPEIEATSVRDWAISLVQKVFDGTNNILASGHFLNKHEESFNLVSKGWALGILHGENENPSFDSALELLNQAKSIQEDIEQRQDLPRTLILLAHFFRKSKRLEAATKAVNDCLAIAWTAEMKLYQCDAYLERCHIAFDMSVDKHPIFDKRTMLDYYRTAKRSIEDIKYNKRLHNLRLLRQDILDKYSDITESDLPPVGS